MISFAHFVLLGVSFLQLANCQLCPNVRCNIPSDGCAHGFQTDQNGCQQCQCFDPNACPAIDCPARNAAGFCPNGFLKDDHGCETCDCFDPNIHCPAIDCMASCPNGFAKTPNGCPMCDCNPDPVPAVPVPAILPMPAPGPLFPFPVECPVVKCAAPPGGFCANGFLKDQNGCQTCECLDRAKHCPANLDCSNAACIHGFQKDHNGCQTCNCMCPVGPMQCPLRCPPRFTMDEIHAIHEIGSPGIHPMPMPGGPTDSDNPNFRPARKRLNFCKFYPDAVCVDDACDPTTSCQMVYVVNNTVVECGKDPEKQRNKTERAKEILGRIEHLLDSFKSDMRYVEKKQSPPPPRQVLGAAKCLALNTPSPFALSRYNLPDPTKVKYTNDLWQFSRFVHDQSKDAMMNLPAGHPKVMTRPNCSALGDYNSIIQSNVGNFTQTVSTMLHKSLMKLKKIKYGCSVDDIAKLANCHQLEIFGRLLMSAMAKRRAMKRRHRGGRGGGGGGRRRHRRGGRRRRPNEESNEDDSDSSSEEDNNGFGGAMKGIGMITSMVKGIIEDTLNERECKALTEHRESRQYQRCRAGCDTIWSGRYTIPGAKGFRQRCLDQCRSANPAMTKDQICMLNCVQRADQNMICSRKCNQCISDEEVKSKSKNPIISLLEGFGLPKPLLSQLGGSLPPFGGKKPHFKPPPPRRRRPHGVKRPPKQNPFAARDFLRRKGSQVIWEAIYKDIKSWMAANGYNSTCTPGMAFITKIVLDRHKMLFTTKGELALQAYIMDMDMTSLLTKLGKMAHRRKKCRRHKPSEVEMSISREVLEPEILPAKKPQVNPILSSVPNFQLPPGLIPPKSPDDGANPAEGGGLSEFLKKIMEGLGGGGDPGDPGDDDESDKFGESSESGESSEGSNEREGTNVEEEMTEVEKEEKTKFEMLRSFVLKKEEIYFAGIEEELGDILYEDDDENDVDSEVDDDDECDANFDIFCGLKEKNGDNCPPHRRPRPRPPHHFLPRPHPKPKPAFT